MKIIEPGHVYQLKVLDHECRFPDALYEPPSDLFQYGPDLLVFVNREEGTEHAGYQTQEVLCALIDRTQHCDACVRWPGNDAIVAHLRMALALHECRAIQRKVALGKIEPEMISTDNDGHWPLREHMSRKDQRTLARNVQSGVYDSMKGETKPVDKPEGE